MVTKRKSAEVKATINAKPSMFQLPPGLYAIRALPNPKHQVINRVTLTQAPVGHARVDYLPAAGIEDNTFAQPNDCIAVRVMHETATMVATEFHAGAALSVRLEIERIDIPKAQASPAPVKPSGGRGQGAGGEGARGDVMSGDVMSGDVAGGDVARGQVASTRLTRLAQTSSVRLLGHLEGLGDTIVQDQWLGDPSGRGRLEGFAIKVKGLPATVKLVYGCKFTNPALKTQVSSTGQFVGTRRQAQPIRSVVFGLEGPGADQYQLVGEVAFGGAHNQPEYVPIVPVRELQGSRKDAYLVAIHLQVVSKSALVQPSAISSPLANLNGEDNQESQDDQDMELPDEISLSQATRHVEPERDNDLDPSAGDHADEEGGAWTDDDIADVFGRASPRHNR